MCRVFSTPGPENTDESLRIAFSAAGELGLEHVIVASTYGDTARKAWALAAQEDAQLVIVTHNTGFKEPGKQQFDADLRRELQEAGVPVVTGTMPFRGISRALRDRAGGSEIDIVANTLRILCEGIKVCAEIACMACDAGVVPPEDVICVAGTGRGADTVAVVAAQPSNRFFHLKIRQILAKPWTF